MPLYLSRIPVLSSFLRDEAKFVASVAFLPVLTLDQAIKPFQEKNIALLSVDTEGLDYEVLLGGEAALDKTYVICVESNRPEDRERITKLLNSRFEAVAEFGCNTVFRRRNSMLG
jgi:hypothetical protein